MVDIKTKIQEDSKQGGSSAGYSFVKSYQACPRRFALENLLGVKTEGHKWALEQGKILHGAMECAYKGYSHADLMFYIAEMSRMSYPHEQDDADKMFERVSAMVTTWCEEFLEKDLEVFTDFQYEMPIEIPLLGGISMTGRFDKLYTDTRTGALVIGDYKSTSRSIKTMEQQSRMGDQFTLYTHAAKKMWPERRVITVIDVLWGRELKSGFKVDVARQIPLVYTQDQLDRVVASHTGLMIEIAQKVKAYLNDDMPMEFLFPRNGTLCGVFGCPYEKVCRDKITSAVCAREGMTMDKSKAEELQHLKGIKISLEEL